MAYFNTGKIIRDLRKQKGLTQGQLSEGIIETVTLSRIENGKQHPNKTTLDALMQRLGFDPDTYPGNFVGDSEFQLFELKQLAMEALTAHNYHSLEYLVREMKKLPEIKNKLHQQFVMRLESIVADFKNDTSISPIEYTLEAIRITLPMFDDGKLDAYILTNQEIRLVNSLAIFYAQDGDMERGIALYKRLKKSLENSCIKHMERNKAHALVLYNLSKYLGLNAKPLEAIKVCDEGAKVCVDNNLIDPLPALVYNKAWILNEIGHKKEARELIYRAYYGSLMANQLDDAEVMKEFARDALNVTFTDLRKAVNA